MSDNQSVRVCKVIEANLIPDEGGSWLLDHELGGYFKSPDEAVRHGWQIVPAVGGENEEKKVRVVRKGRDEESGTVEKDGLYFVLDGRGCRMAAYTTKAELQSVWTLLDEWPREEASQPQRPSAPAVANLNKIYKLAESVMYDEDCSGEEGAEIMKIVEDMKQSPPAVAAPQGIEAILTLCSMIREHADNHRTAAIKGCVEELEWALRQMEAKPVAPPTVTVDEPGAAQRARWATKIQHLIRWAFIRGGEMDRDQLRDPDAAMRALFQEAPLVDFLLAELRGPVEPTAAETCKCGQPGEPGCGPWCSKCYEAMLDEDEPQAAAAEEQPWRAFYSMDMPADGVPFEARRGHSEFGDVYYEWRPLPNPNAGGAGNKMVACPDGVIRSADLLKRGPVDECR